MKKVITTGIGGRSFIINEDAYGRLESYLNTFRAHVKDVSKDEVMDELENRIADIFYTEVGDSGRVIDLDMVQKVIAQLGMPDGSDSSASAYEPQAAPGTPARKLYRDTDDVRIAGVCSGLALYFGVDTALVRIIMLVALIVGSAGFWIYVILWIAVPKALTPAQKCELRGLAPTASNLAKFSTFKK